MSIPRITVHAIIIVMNALVLIIDTLLIEILSKIKTFRITA